MPLGSQPLHLTLHYQHGLGGLAPYFTGLSQGRAVASRCKACGRAWCPPHLCCPADGSEVDWVELQGTGSVISLTETATELPLGSATATYLFGLVRLDGAENAMFARLDLPEAERRPTARVRLVKALGEWPHPAQSAVFVPLTT